MNENIIIVDFGSQVTKLIARRVRDFGVFSQIIPFHSLKEETFKKKNVKGLIFSGGPSSVSKETSPQIEKFVYKLNIPILGVCYGLQLICRDFGGEVKLSNEREFGKTKIKILKDSPLLKNANVPVKFSIAPSFNVVICLPFCTAFFCKGLWFREGCRASSGATQTISFSSYCFCKGVCFWGGLPREPCKNQNAIIFAL